MKLSILIPSNSPDKLEQFLFSYGNYTSNKKEIELIILIDDTTNYVEMINNNLTMIHRIPDKVLNISALQYECLKIARGKWIMLGNDDCIIETPDWDNQIFYAMDHFKDEIALIYPNDNMFGQNLACFPIISKKLIDMVDLFPMKYHRYKVDDTIFNLLPPARRIYLPNCKFTHLNDKGKSGFTLADGRIYPVDRFFADIDAKIWVEEGQKRSEMSQKVLEFLGFNEIKVLVGVSTAEMARRASFYDYLDMLDKPMGTLVTKAHGQSPAKSRNLIIEQALQHGCTHILFIDDDTAFPPNMLTQLLSHNKDIVTAYCLMRNYPHRPLIFDKRNDDGACCQYFPKEGETGLVEIVNAGLGCVLIKTDVFKSMNKPWITLGELTKDDWCDDISFFNRVSDAGFKMYCDLDCKVGHMASCIIFPVQVEGRWHVSYDTNGEGQVMFPMIRPTIAKECDDKSLSLMGAK